MVLPVPTDMFLSNIDPVYPARAGPAASQNSPPSNAPTKTLIALGDRGRCFVEGTALSRSFHDCNGQGNKGDPHADKLAGGQHLV
jgi:hypothetical protein